MDERLYKWNDICSAVYRERVRQEDRWGNDSLMPYENGDHQRKLAVLMEEVGEVARELLENGNRTSSHLKEELIQVAAVAMAWIEGIERYHDIVPRHGRRIRNV